VLAGDEQTHGPLIDIVAGQLGVPVDVWDVYGGRDATRRSHLLEMLHRLGMEQFGTRQNRSILTWLGSTALLTTRGIILAHAVVDELWRQLIVLPPLPVIERLNAIGDLGLSLEAGYKLHQNRLLQLAREAGQIAVFQLNEYEQARRHATLVALMIERWPMRSLTSMIDWLAASSLSRKTNTNELLPSWEKPSTTRCGFMRD
jgi:Domain of unknown function (DUF4158)